jgi:hypothetical protein
MNTTPDIMTYIRFNKFIKTKEFQDKMKSIYIDLFYFNNRRWLSFGKYDRFSNRYSIDFEK